MKKIITLSMLLLLLVVSCKKDTSTKTITPSGQYYLKFKLNGTQKQYTGLTTGLIGTPSSPDGCDIIGYTGGTQAVGVTIAVIDNAPITTNKTYTQAVGVFTYVDEAGIAYSAGSIFASTSFNMTITEITTDHVKGTFTAVLQKEGTPIQYANATEGQFYVNRLQ